MPAMKKLLPRKLAAMLLTAFVASGCSGMLDVEDPSRYIDENLNDERTFAALANGVEGNFTTMAGVVINSGLLSDELMHTGTWTGYEDADKGRYRAGDGSDAGASGSWLVTRTQAQKAEERFVKVLGDAAYDKEYTARVKAVEGWTYLLMGMYACEGVATPNGPAVSDIEMYKAAIPVLTRAIELATRAKLTNYANMARAGRARANLMAGNFDAALADAQAIPAGFSYFAKFSEQGTSNALVTLIHHTENKAAGLDSRRWSQVDTIAGFLRDKWSNELDTRVKIVHRVGNRLGVDGRTKYYSHDKYKVRGDDIAMTHWREMRLIEAEVHYRKGNLQLAIDRMNVVRASANLPALANPGTPQGVLDRLLEERFATLFLEGQRANDLYRFNLVPSVIGTGYSTKFPLNTNEVRNNPNITPIRDCPKVS